MIEMDKKNRIERISLMEDRFDELARILGELDRVTGEFEDFKSAFDALKDYMESGAWQEDYEADEAGQIPADLKRGVLSEDSLYNLLHDAEQTIAKALKVLGGE